MKHLKKHAMEWKQSYRLKGILCKRYYLQTDYKKWSDIWFTKKMLNTSLEHKAELFTENFHEGLRMQRPSHRFLLN